MQMGTHATSSLDNLTKCNNTQRWMYFLTLRRRLHRQSRTMSEASSISGGLSSTQGHLAAEELLEHFSDLCQGYGRALPQALRLCLLHKGHISQLSEILSVHFPPLYNNPSQSRQFSSPAEHGLVQAYCEVLCSLLPQLVFCFNYWSRLTQYLPAAKYSSLTILNYIVDSKADRNTGVIQVLQS